MPLTSEQAQQRFVSYHVALQTEQQKIAHLLRRFGLGASEAELDFYGQGGLASAINRLIEFEKTEDNWPFSLQLAASANGNIPVRAAQAFWYSRLIATNRPLQERLTIFWHDHFATSGAKVIVGPAMHSHIQTLRENALAAFPTLLHAISKDPAMLFWLDNQENVAGRPNENFAREVMELFTIGIGRYTEKDVQEGARAFTGWTYGRRTNRGVITPERVPRGGQFHFDARRHDDDEKVFLGRRGNFNGEDVLDMLCKEPATSRNIVVKMWEWFAYSSPETTVVEKLAKRYEQSGLDTKVLVRAIMESPEFYSEKAEKGVVKDPVFFCISTLRALGLARVQLRQMQQASEADDQEAVVRIRPNSLGAMTMQATTSMGMELMEPPDVAGWQIGTGWISSASMIERINWAENIFGNRTRGAARFTAINEREKGTYFHLILGGISSPADSVDRILSILNADNLFDKKEVLIAAALEASGGRVSPQNSAKVWLAVSKLIFGSPEFQFC